MNKRNCMKIIRSFESILSSMEELKVRISSIHSIKETTQFGLMIRKRFESAKNDFQSVMEDIIKLGRKIRSIEDDCTGEETMVDSMTVYRCWIECKDTCVSIRQRIYSIDSKVESIEMIGPTDDQEDDTISLNDSFKSWISEDEKRGLNREEDNNYKHSLSKGEINGGKIDFNSKKEVKTISNVLSINARNRSDNEEYIGIDNILKSSNYESVINIESYNQRFIRDVQVKVPTNESIILQDRTQWGTKNTSSSIISFDYREADNSNSSMEVQQESESFKYITAQDLTQEEKLIIAEMPDYLIHKAINNIGNSSRQHRQNPSYN